jgi:putative endonuclease
MDEIKTRYIYMILCDNDRYYIGVTDDIKRRYKQHAAGTGAGYTRTNGVKKLAKVWAFEGTSSDLYTLERRIKDNIFKYPKKNLVDGTLHMERIAEAELGKRINFRIIDYNPQATSINRLKNKLEEVLECSKNTFISHYPDTYLYREREFISYLQDQLMRLGKYYKLIPKKGQELTEVRDKTSLTDVIWLKNESIVLVTIKIDIKAKRTSVGGFCSSS